MDQLYQNHALRESSKTKESENVFQKAPDAKDEDQQIYNDGTGPIRYTNSAILRPAPYPTVLIELNKNLPPLPEGIPVSVAPECPAPPRDH